MDARQAAEKIVQNYAGTFSLESEILKVQSIIQSVITATAELAADRRRLMETNKRFLRERNEAREAAKFCYCLLGSDYRQQSWFRWPWLRD